MSERELAVCRVCGMEAVMTDMVESSNGAEDYAEPGCLIDEAERLYGEPR